MKDYLDIIEKEVVMAEGCTEPIAVAYACSIASKTLNEDVKNIKIYLSTNMIKNCLGVGIPGTGQVGAKIAAALGVLIKDPSKKLEILSGFERETLLEANKLQECVTIHHFDTPKKLYIKVILESENGTSTTTIEDDHTFVSEVTLNNKVVYSQKALEATSDEESYDLSLKDIYEYATTVPYHEITFLREWVKANEAVSKEGLENMYGLQVGAKLFHQSAVNLLSNSFANLIVARTSAASDARMDGCTLPVMTVAGSGNQGITCTLPIVELGKLLNKSDEEITRALVLSILIVCYIKQYMGRLAPICGAGIAGATGASCGIVYLQGGNFTQITYAIKNMLGDISGMICDGAKTSCALKIATGVNAGIQCANLALNNICPTSNDGIVCDDADELIRSFQTLVSKGLKNTDETILDMMLHKGNK